MDNVKVDQSLVAAPQHIALRDYFALEMAKYLRINVVNAPEWTAKEAYRLADALIDARQKKVPPQDVLDLWIVDLTEFSVRARNRLCVNGIKRLRDLVQKTPDELLVFPKFGETTLNEVRDHLHERGLSLLNDS